MKTNNATKKGAYIGAGTGLVLFAVFGLLPGSLIGGTAGLSLAGMLFGLPVEPTLLSRIIIVGSMLVGVLVAGIIIVTATTTMGWLVGTVVDRAAEKHEHAVHARSK